ncbi:MAG: DUF2726 domain-containing protein [Acidobacteriaceae bacterium]|nr:DUF2726 domain-containing protein [Acidobacteriaceae bacterium]
MTIPRIPAEFAVFAALAALLVLWLLFGRRKPWLAHIRPKPLLTDNELEFFNRLTRALPHYYVFPQVSLGAIMDANPDLSAKQRWIIRSHFDRKVADFIICEPRTLKVLAIIELDDRTHDARRDRERDAITQAAGIQTLRYSSREKPSTAEIARTFKRAYAALR